MKWVLIVLVFLNLLFFGYTEIRQDRATESLLAHQNISADKIRILDGSEKGALAPNAPVALARSCVEWGPAAGTDLANIRKIVAPLLVKDQVREDAGIGARYWVYVPPYASEAQAAQRLQALQADGITDSLIIRNDPALRNGVSLGVLKDEAAAKAQLDMLKKKGVNDARIIARAKPGAPANFLFVLEDPSVGAEFDKLKKAYPALVAKDVSCPPITT